MSECLLIFTVTFKRRKKPPADQSNPKMQTSFYICLCIWFLSSLTLFSFAFVSLATKTRGSTFDTSLLQRITGRIKSTRSSTVSSTSHLLKKFSKEDIIQNSQLLATKNEDNNMDVEKLYSSNVMTTYGRYPITMVKGKGCTLIDSNDKTYLDFVAGISTCALGHGNEKLTKALTEQMSTLHHVSNLYYIPQQGKLAEWLVKNSCADKVFFCNSGAEANEGAIKLARKYGHTVLNIPSDEVPYIITAKSSFHGRTLAAVSATGQPKYHENFGPMVPGFEYVDYNSAESLNEKVAEMKQNGKKLTAIMMEALQGEGGIRPGQKEFFQAIDDIRKREKCLLIVDEVQTGIGRTGKLWGHQNLDIEPDIFTSAKALGGGVPIGALLCKDRVNLFQPGEHASTFGGNPLACAAGLVIANSIDNENLLDNVGSRGEQLRKGLNKIMQKYPDILVDVRGWGLINGVEVRGDLQLLAGDIVNACTKKGLLLVAAGLKVVRFVPPLIVSETEVNQALRTFEEVLEEIKKKMEESQ